MVPTGAAFPAEARSSDTLSAGLAAMEISFGPSDLKRLNAYLDLLMRWSRVYGLTARASREEIVVRHVLDSASVLPFLPSGLMLDAGSGAGLPGLVLALLRPQTEWVLLDPAARKVAFLRHACAELDLANVRVVRARLERYQPGELPRAIITRALAPLPRLVGLAEHLLRRGSWLLAMLGRRPSEEELSALAGVTCHSRERLRVPGLDAQRHLAVFKYHHESQDQRAVKSGGPG